MAAIDDDDRFVKKPGVIETDLDHELILLDPTTQEMFSLNATGRATWTSLGADRSFGALVSGLVERFAVERAVADRDARMLLEQLLAAGLIAHAD